MLTTQIERAVGTPVLGDFDSDIPDRLVVRKASPRSPGAADPLDLRRRSTNASGREAARLCVERAVHLAPGERETVLAVYRDGVTVKDLAAITAGDGIRHPAVGIRSADSAARALRRRLRLITARLLSAKFEFVIAFLEPADQAERRRLGLPCWPASRRQVAELCIVQGRSMREAARALGGSLHAVRREMSAIHALFEARQWRGH